VNGFNIVYQEFIAMYDSGCQIFCNWSRLKLGFFLKEASTPTYHAAYKHDTPPNHLNRHWALNGEC